VPALVELLFCIDVLSSREIDRVDRVVVKMVNYYKTFDLVSGFIYFGTWVAISMILMPEIFPFILMLSVVGLVVHTLWVLAVWKGKKTDSCESCLDENLS
jgi:NhaP-type Na+/H+ or K+/H+ antiporter